jgi:hypothetical protein
VNRAPCQVRFPGNQGALRLSQREDSAFSACQRTNPKGLSAGSGGLWPAREAGETPALPGKYHCGTAC